MSWTKEPVFYPDTMVYYWPSTGDDERILIAARGGPGKFQVTGWLQIEGLKKEHEGDYTCVAKNSEKKVHAKARVKVEQLEAKVKYLLKKQKHL